MAEQFFVGYGQLESMLNTHDRAKPIYIELVHINQGGTPVQIVDSVVYVTDIEDGVCRYWRRVVARTEYIGGSPFDAVKAQQASERARSARQVIEQQIRELHEFDVRSALVAIPQDLRLLEGDTDCMRFDSATKQYVAA